MKLIGICVYGLNNFWNLEFYKIYLIEWKWKVRLVNDCVFVNDCVIGCFIFKNFGYFNIVI